MAEVGQGPERRLELARRDPEVEARLAALRLRAEPGSGAPTALGDARVEDEAVVLLDRVEDTVGGVAETVGRGREREIDVAGDLALVDGTSLAREGSAADPGEDRPDPAFGAVGSKAAPPPLSPAA